MNDDLKNEDVLVWLCRDGNGFLSAIEAYRNGEQEQPGRTFDEQISKVFHAVEEYSCSRLLLVCEKDSSYAAFIKNEYKKRLADTHSPKDDHAVCELIPEEKFASAMEAMGESAIYVVPDDHPIPQTLEDAPKYFFDYEEMIPWPAGRRVESLCGKRPAAWTRFFLPGTDDFAIQLENVRTILKHKNESGVPQYVLITGETGTGKSFFTRNLPAICREKYDDRSEEFKEPSLDERTEKNYGYLQGNCASLSPELADALLFGAVAGAYTGCTKNIDGLIESAGDGILFLDEVGDLPLETQGKLLTALEEKTYQRLGDTGKKREIRHVGCSIVFGTNRDLSADAQEWEATHGKSGFRKDLLFRINSCHLVIPPLRERLSDKNHVKRKELLEDIVKQSCESIGLMLTDGARREFERFACQYEWPGNFRDVKHLFEGLKIKALVEHTGMVVSAKTMKDAVEKLKGTKPPAAVNDMPLIDRTKTLFPSPYEANEIDFIFEICGCARSCADAGRAYYGTDKQRNFADAFKKRLAHFKLAFDNSAPSHLLPLNSAE